MHVMCSFYKTLALMYIPLCTGQGHYTIKRWGKVHRLFYFQYTVYSYKHVLFYAKLEYVCNFGINKGQSRTPMKTSGKVC